MSALDAAGLDLIFREARTRNGWSPEPISDDQIREIYDTLKFGPTSANNSPARFVWVRSEAAKARLKPHLMEGNYKALKASAIVIIGQDLDFPDHMHKLFPQVPNIKDWYADPQQREVHAFRNATLQGAYLIIAARALGLDVGPMSGFNNAGVDAEFFAGTNVKSNFIAAIGHGTEENLFPRNPRFAFDEVNTIL